MEINKAVMTLDGNNLKLSVPFAKVDAERRTVSGFATLDNVDQQGDIVTAEASKAAFTRFRGNLREMHAPIAVGKVLDFSEEEFYDAQTDKTYRGIFVSAFVSKGAEDTWQKVLDGTLSGFSIGGKVLDAETVYEKAVDANVQVIKDYQLLELSLVDSPANQFANVFAITKSVDGEMMVKGIAVDVSLENILYCKTDKIAVASAREDAECAVCGNKMENIGWVESSASDKTEKIRDAVASATLVKSLSNSPTSTTSSTNGLNYYITVNSTLPAAEVARQVQESINKTLEGGVDELSTENTKTEVTEETKTTVSEETATPVEEVTPTEEAPAVEETVEKAAEVEEVEAEEVDLAKMFNDFASEIKTVLTSVKDETAEVIKSVKSELEAAVSAVDTRVSELATQFGAVSEKVEVVDKRVDSVESDTAIKKSSDLGRSEDKIEKNESFWGSRFLTTDQIVS